MVKLEITATVVIGYILLTIGILMMIFAFSLGVWEYYNFPILQLPQNFLTNVSNLIVKATFIIIMFIVGGLISKRGVSMIIGKEVTVADTS
jgi:hypothetical protein